MKNMKKILSIVFTKKYLSRAILIIIVFGFLTWLSRTNLNTSYTQFCAAGVTVAIPVVAVFLALQKYYVQGVTGGAVKG